MTVTPARTNVLLCSQLIAATSRLLVTACKGVEVTPDKIARKYPEVSVEIVNMIIDDCQPSCAGIIRPQIVMNICPRAFNIQWRLPGAICFADYHQILASTRFLKKSQDPLWQALTN